MTPTNANMLNKGPPCLRTMLHPPAPSPPHHSLSPHPQSPNALSVEGGSHHRQTQSATTAHEAGGSHHRQSAGLASQTETSREPWLRRRPSQLMGVTGAGDEASVDVPGRDALEAFYVRLLDAVVLLATDPASRCVRGAAWGWVGWWG